MASFDIMQASGKGYRFLWEKRVFIAKFIALPIVVKFVALIAISALNLEDNHLRQGLIMLPAYFIDGLVLCALIQVFLVEQDLLKQARKTESAEKTKIFSFNLFSGTILSGAVMFTLIKLVAALIFGVMYSQNLMSDTAEMPKTEPNVSAFLAAIATMFIIFWSFRLVWLHVPIVMGITIAHYLRQLKGLYSSLYLFAVWVLCSIPFIIAVLVLSDLLAAMTGSSAESPSQVYRFLLLGVQASIDIIVSIVTTIAIAAGIREMMQGTKK